MPRKGMIGGNPPKVIQIINGGSGWQPFSNLGTSKFTAAAINQVAAEIPLDPLSSTINLLNTSPYMIGVFYLFLNLGGRFISMELTKRQEWFLSQPFLRPFILFAVMFISTRNLASAFWTTIGILLVLWVFANENSAFCLIPGWKEEIPNNNYDKHMKKFQKHEIPEDGHHEDVKAEIKPLAEVKAPNIIDIKPPANNIDVKNSEPRHEIDDYANKIKEDPVPHENIKEGYANYIR
jgi:hypothetical protein